jgi:hypothetical protein
MNDLYRVSAEGGTPMAISEERYVNEFSVAPSPDGRSAVIAARGIASAQWWRRGSSHIDQSELWWLSGLDATPAYRQLTPRDARQVWPMWRQDGRAVYYVSDRGGVENIWIRPMPAEGAGTAQTLDAGRRLTTFTDGRVLFPSLFQNSHLQNFIALFLAAGKSFIDATVQELWIHIEQGHFFPGQFQKLESVNFIEPLIRALCVQGSFKQVGVIDAGDFYRVLESEKNATTGTLLRG